MSADVVIVGGGLAGSLAAWRLAVVRADLDVRLIESGPALGGNHTWSLHDTDVSATQAQWLAPLVRQRWPRHEVRFPQRQRILEQGYASLDASTLHAIIAPVLGARLLLNTSVAELTRRHVTTSTGQRVDAGIIIDARGPAPVAIPLGWQTFLGQEVECEAPHGVAHPMLMDASVPQDGAYKFVYVLPWDAHRLLIEDTAYADRPEVDATAARLAIGHYATQRGWRIRRLIREETGSLPLPLGGAADAFWPDDVPRIGLRAGLFHPTTGYSLPDAVATADHLTAMDPGAADRVYSEMRDLATTRWRERGMFRLLNRMLFRAATPAGRVRVLEQFYGRPADLIARFYAARLTRRDQLRLLAGWPPVPLHRALAQLRG